MVKVTESEKTIKKLIAQAHAIASKCKFGHYPMAPSVGLSEKQIGAHKIAKTAYSAVIEALTAAGRIDETHEFRKYIEEHSWVTSRRGAF